MFNFTDEEFTRTLLNIADAILSQKNKTVICIPIPNDVKLQMSYTDSNNNKHIINLKNEIIIDYKGIMYYDVNLINNWIRIQKCTPVTRKIYEYVTEYLACNVMFPNK